MKNPKTIKVTIPVEPSLANSGRLVDCGIDEFLNWARGEIATALFKGEVDRALCWVVNIARTRGKKYYHEQLVKEAQENGK